LTGGIDYPESAFANQNRYSLPNLCRETVVVKMRMADGYPPQGFIQFFKA